MHSDQMRMDLSMYTTEPLPVEGTMTVEVKYGDYCAQ